jgi:serine/threonine protein kinase
MMLLPSCPTSAWTSSNNSHYDDVEDYKLRNDVKTSNHLKEQDLAILQHQSVFGPAISLNGQLRRVNTLGTLVPLRLEPGNTNPDKLRRGEDYLYLRQLLVACQISHMDTPIKFWPGQLLRRILTEERVKKELSCIEDDENQGLLWGHGVQWYLSMLFPSNNLDFDAERESDYGVKLGDRRPKRIGTNYLNIYAILILCDKQPSIRAFIEAGITDDDLPFVECDTGRLKGTIKLASWQSPLKEIECFKKWQDSVIELFHDSQYKVLVPYFSLASNPQHTIKYVEYYERTILPWIEDMNKKEEGGHGVVSCRRIHPASHGFQGLAQIMDGNEMFALKRIISPNVKNFKNETEMLRMFSGHHDHLIMHLMSFSHKGENYLLFPWADCDLDIYWSDDNNKSPYDATTKRIDSDSMKWVSKQILGLTSGLHQIHNPTHLHDRSDMRYGRHGDIKPENILWFKSAKDPKGILVIGDLGISAIHREVSRSNQPGKDIPHTPNYRPPECDLEGGIISRAFDIWTLGCLFLEMICWTLGGKNLVAKFENDRSKVLYLGINSCTNIFFHIQENITGGYVMNVKDSVARVRGIHL